MSRTPLSQSPGLLVFALLAGAATGAAVPFTLTWLGAVSQAYIALLNMVALPLIVLSVCSGLRQWPSQPGASGLRMVRLLVVAVASMAVFAGLGAGLAMLLSAGPGDGVIDAGVVGRLAMEVEPAVRIDLWGRDATPPAVPPWDWVVPDNGYRVLAYGTLGSALLGVLFFGAGLAAQGAARSRAFLALADGVYRSLETLVGRVNTLLPFFAFALAASTVNAMGLHLLARMQEFLVPLALVALGAVAVAVLVVSLRLRLPGLRVLAALRLPLVVSLFSSSPAAAVPGLIDALCNQLGFRRDLMELAAPLMPTFLRLGDAVFFGVLGVFVANVYGKPLGPADLMLVAAASTAAALASPAWSSGWSLAAGGVSLMWLDLPFEALLPTFVLLEVATAGVRTLLSVLLVAPLLALVARDLMSQAPRPVEAAPRRPAVRLGLALRPRQTLAMVSLLVVAMLAAFLAGIGVGLREEAPPAPVHDIHPGMRPGSHGLPATGSTA